jgi:hypothetical protein
MSEPLGQGSSGGCRRCGACEHFDGVPGAADNLGECHNPSAPQAQPKQESECCDGFRPATSAAWREATRIVYTLPPRRPAAVHRPDIYLARRAASPV